MEILKTFILSRHSLRRPLFEVIECKDVLNDKWYSWDEKRQLTDRGRVFEEKLAKYLKKYLPNKNVDFGLSITDTDRTKETASILMRNLLDKDIEPDKYVNGSKFINFSVEDNKKEVYLKEIYELYNKLNNYELQQSYKKIDKILKDRQTDITLYKFNTEIEFLDDKFLDIHGELATYFDLADILYSEYYEGHFKDVEFLESIRLVKETGLAIFSQTGTIAKIRGKALIKNLYDFLNEKEYNLDIYVGHDVNILNFLHCLDIKYELPKSIEYAPIGGKVVIIQTQYEIIFKYCYLNNYNFNTIEDVEIFRMETEKFINKLKNILNEK